MTALAGLGYHLEAVYFDAPGRLCPNCRANTLRGYEAARNTAGPKSETTRQRQEATAGCTWQESARPTGELSLVSVHREAQDASDCVRTEHLTRNEES